MIDQETLWYQFSTLPPSAREEITDFLAFLHAKYTRIGAPSRTPAPLAQDPFVGLWHDRADMQEATTWVRTLRTQEWQ